MTEAGNGSVSIRRANFDERRALEDLQRRTALVSQAYRAALIANPDAIELPPQQIAAGAVWVAEVQGRIAGFSVVVSGDGDDAELDGLFVEPHFWRQGLGTRLTDHAACVAKAQGATTLTVVASPEARDFYVAQGFVETAKVPTRFGVALAMRRPLPSKT